MVRHPVLGAVLFGLAACSPFAANGGGSDGGVSDAGAAEAGETCPAPTCAGAGPSCKSYDFAGPKCPSDWQLSGDFNLGVTASCDTGALHVLAGGTLDVFASLDLTTPNVAYGMRVSARVAVDTWDGGAMLKLSFGGKVVVALVATTKANGNPELVVCDASSTCGDPVESTQGKSHLLVVELRESGITATLDCAPFGTFAGVPLPRNAGFSLDLGKAAEPKIEGSLDDVTVSFF